MRYYTDDPIADFHRWEDDVCEWLEKRPICEECGEHIQDDFAYCIDNKWYCKDCIDGMLEEIVTDDMDDDFYCEDE